MYFHASLTQQECNALLRAASPQAAVPSLQLTLQQQLCWAAASQRVNNAAELECHINTPIQLQTYEFCRNIQGHIIPCNTYPAGMQYASVCRRLSETSASAAAHAAAAALLGCCQPGTGH
jgi:hypothetical protein